MLHGEDAPEVVPQRPVTVWDEATCNSFGDYDIGVKEVANGLCDMGKILPARPLAMQLERLLAAQTPIQEEVGGVASHHVGLGHRAEDNIAMRRRVGQPGAPFGGMGFWDPQLSRGVQEAYCCGQEKQLLDAPPAHVTAEFVRDLKVREFERCAEGGPSIYYWALQPIVDNRNRVVAAEILVRAKNGTDCAPFEDLCAIMDPNATEEVRRVYAAWKAEEVVVWPLHAMKENPILGSLKYISTNLRPSDLLKTSLVYQEITRKLSQLSAADRELLKRKIVIEVTEDQDLITEIGPALEAWRQDLGFRLSYDDTIGQSACDALRKTSENFHTTKALKPLLRHFDWLKVDIEWAGQTLFLCHPSYASRPAMKAEVLRNAVDHDQVWVANGTGLRNTEAKHSEMLREFAEWALDMIGMGKHLCIELSVRPEDENSAFALEKLRLLGLDILGEHRAHFHFQGGPTGAKAFEPDVFAAAAMFTGAAAA